MNKLDQHLLDKKYTRYWKTLSAVSDSLGKVFADCSKKVFHYEGFCASIPKLADTCKVDAIALKRSNTSISVTLLEFKGGKTTDNWDKEALAFKAIDTILCGLSQFVNFDRCAWATFFCNQSLRLDYCIIISDEHVISKAEEKGLEIIKGRNVPQKGKEEKRSLKSKLRRYGNKRPFDNIDIVCATKFLKDVGKVVGE